MPEFTKTELIWNRACGLNVSVLTGDRALEDLLFVHALVMNGGVFHAVRSIDPELVAAAESGYRYFGYDAVADLLNKAKSLSGTVEELT
jgi:hypothetical protein